MNIKPKRSYAWSILVLFLIIGWIYPVLGVMALVCMLAPIIVALVSGKRKWCALFCPRGIFSDVILGRISRHRKAPALLTSNYFKIGFLIFLTTNLFWGIANAGGDWVAIGMVFVRLVSLTTAIAIVLGYIYSQRTWCGFCPMGFLATLSIKARRFFKAPRQAPQQPSSDKPGVVLYTGDQCPACDGVKDMLQDLKVAFKEINIDRDRRGREVMVDNFKSASVPTLVMDGKPIKNIKRENLEKLFSPKDIPMAG